MFKRDQELAEKHRLMEI